jgi:hypothetical protein
MDVRTTLPHTTPRRPVLRISPSTEQRPHPSPRVTTGATLCQSVDLQVCLPDPSDLDAQHVITLDTSTAQSRITLMRRVTPVARRRDLHHLADRLDAVGIAVLDDDCPHDLKWRPSPARVRKAIARRRISFALSTSRSSALMRSSRAVLDPGRWPASRSYSRAQRRKLSGRF